MDLGLENKVAIVTGVASEQGIGRSIALSLAREGCSIGCIDIDKQGAEEAAHKIVSTGRKAIALECDQFDYISVKKAVAAVSEWMGGVDILINNAAWMNNVSLMRAMPAASWEKEISINLSGPFYFIKEALPIMMRRRWGRIISISSGLGLTGVAGRAGYCSAKSGLIGLTKTAALEGARGNVTANVMFFGMVDTAGSRATVPRQHWDVIVGRNALQRAASIQEVADVVTFYASEKSAFITGAEVMVDGGQTLLVL
jgi:NAD(P)-dependent dehydrogenase (short-subunit alcohol dehydrogenase family)